MHSNFINIHSIQTLKQFLAEVIEKHSIIISGEHDWILSPHNKQLRFNDLFEEILIDPILKTENIFLVSKRKI